MQKKNTFIIAALVLLFIISGCYRRDDSLIRAFGVLFTDYDNNNSAVVNNYLTVYDKQDKDLKINFNVIEPPNPAIKEDHPEVYEAYLEEATRRYYFKKELDDWFIDADGKEIEKPESYNVVFSLESKNDNTVNSFVLYDHQTAAVRIDNEKRYYLLDDERYDSLKKIYDDYIDGLDDMYIQIADHIN